MTNEVEKCLLTPSERRKWGELYIDDPEVMRLELCKEQLAKDEARFEKERGQIRKAVAEEIKRELEKYSATEKMAYRDGGESLRTIPESTWQSFWERY